MSNNSGLFLTNDSIKAEVLPRGIHHWLSTPELTGSEQLIAVRVEVEPGNGHPFHRHPTMDEMIYVLSGKGEQWLEEDTRMLGKDEAVFIPKGKVHAIYNTGNEPLIFLAILSPVDDLDGSGMVDVSEEEPWCILRENR